MTILQELLPINHLASKDDLRPAMTYIQLLDGYAYATNANVAVRFKCDELFSETGNCYMKAGAWALLSKLSNKKKPQIFEIIETEKGGVLSVNVGDYEVRIDLISEDDFVSINARFPDVRKIIQDNMNRTVEIPVEKFGLYNSNVDLIIKATGKDSSLLFNVVEETKAIKFKVSSDDID